MNTGSKGVQGAYLGKYLTLCISLQITISGFEIFCGHFFQSSSQSIFKFSDENLGFSTIDSKFFHIYNF